MAFLYAINFSASAQTITTELFKGEKRSMIVTITDSIDSKITFIDLGSDEYEILIEAPDKNGGYSSIRNDLKITDLSGKTYLSRIFKSRYSTSRGVRVANQWWYPHYVKAYISKDEAESIFKNGLGLVSIETKKGTISCDFSGGEKTKEEWEKALAEFSKLETKSTSYY